MTRKLNYYHTACGIVHDSIYDSIHDPEDDWTDACLGTDAEYLEKLAQEGSVSTHSSVRYWSKSSRRWRYGTY